MYFGGKDCWISIFDAAGGKMRITDEELDCKSEEIRVKRSVLQWYKNCTTKTGYFRSAVISNLLFHFFEDIFLHRWKIEVLMEYYHM